MKNKKYGYKLAGVVCGFLGIGVLAYVFIPIFSYQLPQATKLGDYLSPVPEEELNVRAVVDYTKPENWFADEPKSEDYSFSGVRFYNISIPKLGIEDAVVAVGGEDLSDSLIQYPGTALPGKRGNSVIFGHSILPQFYNPKDYLSIFSTLPTMKKGDEIVIDYDGIEYLYVVEDVFEVKPTDLEILVQNTSDSFVTLVTCVPPGHPLRPKRLIVRARLEPYGTLSQNVL